MKFLLLFLCLFFSQVEFVFSQLHMKIKDLRVKQIVFDIGNEFEAMDYGPEIDVACLITNPTDSIYTLQLSTDSLNLDKLADIRYVFNYRGRIYRTFTDEIFWSFRGIIGKDTLDMMPPRVDIYPHQSIELFFSTHLLAFTSFTDRLDYTCLLLEILPTFRIYYKDPALSMISTEIMGVTLDDSCIKFSE
jgi:hypothetical protein